MTVKEEPPQKKKKLNPRKILFWLIVAIFVAATPRAIIYAYHHGGFYLFSRQFLEDLPKRLTGPGRFRFILQPTVAIILGIRAGKADAQLGRAPYLFSLFFRGEQRSALLGEAFEHLATLVGAAILLDAVLQFLILHEIFPGAALVVGPVLIAFPYSLSRALSNRWISARKQSAAP
jgi:hypothetical protein